ncbi:MAG: TetR-like C-terminal domain-containing protein [Gemmatimonadota bacterium]
MEGIAGRAASARPPCTGAGRIVRRCWRRRSILWSARSGSRRDVSCRAWSRPWRSTTRSPAPCATASSPRGARRAALRTVLERGIDRCELRRDIDLDLALDFLGGPLFYRLLVTGGPLDDRLAEGTVDIMLRGIACPA